MLSNTLHFILKRQSLPIAFHSFINNTALGDVGRMTVQCKTRSLRPIAIFILFHDFLHRPLCFPPGLHIVERLPFKLCRIIQLHNASFTCSSVIKYFLLHFSIGIIYSCHYPNRILPTIHSSNGTQSSLRIISISPYITKQTFPFCPYIYFFHNFSVRIVSINNFMQRRPVGSQ